MKKFFIFIQTKKHFIGYPIIAFVFLIIGLIWYPLSESVNKADFINIYNDNQYYEISLSIKNKDLISSLNSPKYIKYRIYLGISDILVDLGAPLDLKKEFNRINKEKAFEKIKLAEEKGLRIPIPNDMDSI